MPDRGGNPRSEHIDAHSGLVLSLHAATPGIALREVWTMPVELGVAMGYGGLWRLFCRSIKVE